jgi:nucleotide-binding universal stress UspA family protein
MRLRKILLPTDLSGEGERAVDEMGEVAQRNGASLVLLHVVADIGVVAASEGRSASKGIPGTREEMQNARALLEERKKAFPPGVEVHVDVIAAPGVPQAIVDYAMRNGCDAIALSTHGRGGFRRVVMGSVAEAVLRRSPLPLIVFPRQG